MLHTQSKPDAGFSLVELAMSLIIIGVLVGGVMKGQELVDNSRVTTLGAKVGKYRSAVNSFHDIYDEYPGDMNSPENKIPICAQTTCTYSGTDSGDGDGIIEGISDVQGTDDSDEGRGFWEHLAAANIVVDTKVTPGTTNEFGLTHPASPFGGGFTVLNNPEALDETIPADQDNIVRISVGNFFLVSRTWGSGVGSATISLLSPLLATAVDRKLDDSQADSGKVLGFGDACVDDDGEYDISVTSKACDLLIRF